MDDVQMAKDLLLGKQTVQLRRITDSRIVKLFMRMSGTSKRDLKRDRKYLTNLADYLTSHFSGYHRSPSLSVLDAPGDNADFIVVQIECDGKIDADSVENRFNEYAEVIF